MAQNNPITESGSYASTGGAKAPLDTDSSYGTSTYPSSTTNPTTTITSTHPTTSATHPTTATTTTQPPTGSKLKEAGSGLKQILAGVHGAGEKLRGEFNSTVDRTFNEVCDPGGCPFPSLAGRGMRELACDEDGGV